MSLLSINHVFEGQLASDLARLTAGALIAGLWQGILLSAAAAWLLRVFTKSTAALRFAVWTAVFCVSVAMPFVDLPGAAFASHAGASTASHVVVDMRWSYLLSALWLAASLYRMAALVLQAVGLRALWKSAVPVAGERLNGLDVLLSVRGRRVELCTSEEVDRPSVIGFHAPRILIPAWLLDQLTAVELNHIVLHELEHLRRRDDWVNLLQKIGMVLLPLNPALFWIDRRLSTERELACDDGVLERTRMPRAYAASLASVAERRLHARTGLSLARHAGVLALAATGLIQRRSELGRRIESILGMRAPVNRSFAGVIAALLIAGVLASGAGLARTPQLVSFGQDHAAQLALVKTGQSASRDSVPAPRSFDRGEAAAKYQNASFRTPAKSLPANGRLVKAKLLKPEPVPPVKQSQMTEESIATSTAVAHAAPRQYVVLTSWDDQPIKRVAVATPDGKFVLLPYAAVPTEAGWLLVQL